MSLPGVPVFAGADRNSVVVRNLANPALRRTRRCSWMISGWFEPIDLVSDGGGTACMTLGCSDDFVAVRLGFPNVSERPWRITRAIARPSDSFNDYVTPTGDSSWTTFTTANGGADSTEIVSRNDVPMEIEVRGLDNTPLARAARVSWTWTDWAPLRSLPPDPVTGMRVLMLRALLPSSQRVTYANGQLRSFTGNRALNRGHDILIGGLKFNIDLVSDPDRDRSASTQTWIDNQLAPGTLFPMVQFLTRKPGISGIVTGDSHAQGTSTTEQFSSFLHGATALLGQTHFNNIPFSMTNCAVGGLGSGEFFARFESLMQAVRPSYTVLPGWTFNDTTGAVKADQTAMNIFFARLLSAAEMCEVNGILPIILTPFPRNPEAMTEVQLAPWYWLRESLLGLSKSGTAVIDATAILGHQKDGVFDGTYLPSMSVDQMHPNDDGHVAIAKAIANTLSSRL
jgi:hypothetical protein